MPSLRLGVGSAFHVAPPDDRGAKLGFDATAGFLFADKNGGVYESRAFIGLEAGYAFDGLGLHAFAVTPMVGFGVPLAFVAYQPRLLVGDAERQLALGMRNGLALHALMGLASVEVGHQFVSYADALHHSVQVTFAVDPGLLMWALAKR